MKAEKIVNIFVIVVLSVITLASIDAGEVESTAKTTSINRNLPLPEKRKHRIYTIRQGGSVSYELTDPSITYESSSSRSNYGGGSSYGK